MAPPGKPAKNSALQRPEAPQRRRDPDETDPNAILADFDDDEGTVSDVPPEEDAGPSDKTQVYDATSGPEGETKARFKLVVLSGPKAGAEYELPDEPVTLGRGADNAISIPDVSVSRRHVRFEREGDDAVRVIDLGSGNGTTQNDERISEAVLRHGDEISVGDTAVQLMEIGAPAVKKGRARTPAAPSGESGSPVAPTRGDLPRVKAAKPGAAPPPPPPPGLAPARKLLYVVIGVILVVFLGLAALKKSQQARQNQQQAAEADEGPGEAEQLVADGKKLLRKHQWIAALEKFQAAAELVDDAGLTRLVEQSTAEAEFEKQVAVGKKAIEAQDFLGAKEKLAAVPQKADVYPQAQEAIRSIDAAVAKAAADAKAALASGDKDKARDLVAKVLAVEPGNAVAVGVQTELDKRAKVSAAPVRINVSKKATVEEPPKPVANAAAVAAYLSGDVGRALKLAEDADDQKLLKNLRAFNASYGEGMAKAQGQRASDAVKALGMAARVDREIAQGKPSKPGHEVGKQLANMEYLLGIDCKGDDQLDAAARHFRAALEAEEDHELSKKMIGKVYTRAKELFTEAYLIKGTEPERAKKMFKKVADTLPPDDEKQVKAKYWTDKLDGKGE